MSTRQITLGQRVHYVFHAGWSGPPKAPGTYSVMAVDDFGTVIQFDSDQPIEELPDEVLGECLKRAQGISLAQSRFFTVRPKGQVAPRLAIGERVSLRTVQGDTVTVEISEQLPMDFWGGSIVASAPSRRGLESVKFLVFHELNTY